MLKESEIKSVFRNVNKENTSNIKTSEKKTQEFKEQDNDEFNEEVKVFEDKVREIIENAHNESVEIINKANTEAIEIRSRSERESKESRELGYKEGLEVAKTEYEGLLFEAKELNAKALEEFKNILKHSETEIIKLVINIAKKVIGEELELNENNILYLVKDTLAQTSNLDKIVIKVSPYDYDFLNDNRALIDSNIEGIGDYEIKKVESFKKGTCLVETQSGNIEASIENKIEKIQDVFYEILQS